MRVEIELTNGKVVAADLDFDALLSELVNGPQFIRLDALLINVAHIVRIRY